MTPDKFLKGYTALDRIASAERVRLQQEHYEGEQLLKLKAALEAYDKGNPEPLKQFITVEHRT